MQYYKVELLGVEGYGEAVVYVQAANKDEAADKALDLQDNGVVEWTLSDEYGQVIDLGYWKFGDHAIDSWKVFEVTQEEAEEALL